MKDGKMVLTLEDRKKMLAKRLKAAHDRLETEQRYGYPEDAVEAEAYFSGMVNAITTLGLTISTKWEKGMNTYVIS